MTIKVPFTRWWFISIRKERLSWHVGWCVTICTRWKMWIFPQKKDIA